MTNDMEGEEERYPALSPESESDRKAKQKVNDTLRKGGGSQVTI